MVWMKSLAAILPLASLSSAIITGFAVPSTIANGSSVTIIITTANFIQTVQDVAMSFGLAPSPGYPDSLGTEFLGTKVLGRDFSNIITNITHIVDIPATTPAGPTVFSGGLFNLLGAVYGPNTQDFTVNVTVGDTTSADYVHSS